MHKITLRLDSIERVKAFVELVSRYPFDTDLVSGRYTVNAKYPSWAFLVWIFRSLSRWSSTARTVQRFSNSFGDISPNPSGAIENASQSALHHA